MYQATLAAVHRDERGLLTIANAVTLTGASLMIVFGLNVSTLIDQRVEMQNGADAVAYTGATVVARGMNSVTATNHAIGEMVALSIVHHAIGGDNLDSNDTGDTQTDDNLLRAAHEAHRALGGAAYAYDTVSEEVKASPNSAEFEAKVQLKRALTGVYVGRAVAQGLINTGYLAKIGIGMEAVLIPLENLIRLEYEALNVLHRAARGLVTAAKQLRGSLPSTAQRYARLVVSSTPALAGSAARSVGRSNDCDAHLHRCQPDMPLEIDPRSRSESLSEDNVRETQLARAAFPWVDYHKRPLLAGMSLMLVSQARRHYERSVHRECKSICYEAQTDDGFGGLYVVKREPLPDKGHADWATDPNAADEHFAVVGLTSRKQPAMVGPVVFRQQHDDGRVAYAQALVYNANRFVPKRGVSGKQPRVGWDTLNWGPKNWKGGHQAPRELPESPDEGSWLPNPGDLLGGDRSKYYPHVRLEWQAKLVPTSEHCLADFVRSPGFVPGTMRSPTSRMLATLPSALQTH